MKLQRGENKGKNLDRSWSPWNMCLYEEYFNLAEFVVCYP